MEHTLSQPKGDDLAESPGELLEKPNDPASESQAPSPLAGPSLPSEPTTPEEAQPSHPLIPEMPNPQPTNPPEEKSSAEAQESIEGKLEIVPSGKNENKGLILFFSRYLRPNNQEPPQALAVTDRPPMLSSSGARHTAPPRPPSFLRRHALFLV